MRSSGTLSPLSFLRRLSISPLFQAQGHPIRRHGYCSTCETPPPEDKIPTGSTLSAINNSALKADHRELAKQQQLFTTSIYSPGSPLFLPNGTRIFHKLTKFLRDQYADFGIQEVITPTIYKKSLWKKSGHWDNYADDMYSVTGRGASGKEEGTELQQDEEYGLKPMNCPGHCLLFASTKRSYKELPVRYGDFGALHRNEIHGALTGLTRLRAFHQDDGHIFCRPKQIQQEITSTLDFVKLVYKVLNLGSFRVCLSTRPADHFIGTVEEWDNAEAALKASLAASSLPWTINEGDGAFYGPKIDIILKDSAGKEHQTATIQLDFQLPKRFDLQYSAPAPESEQKGLTTSDPELLAVEGEVTPVLIHRAILGSVERFMAVLIELYNKKYPFWLAPRQVIILTVNNTNPVMEHAQKCQKLLVGVTERSKLGAAKSGERLAVDLDAGAEPLSQKIRSAKLHGYAVIVVVGERDAAEGQLVADFSGLYDPTGAIPNTPLLKEIKNLETVPDKVLKKFVMKPPQLREFLVGLQQDYR